MEKIKELIEKIDLEQRAYDETVYSSASANDKAHFANWARKIHADKVDFAPFISLCEVADGLNHNGLFMYSIVRNSENNVYDANEDFRDCAPENEDYVLLGDDDISWYCVEVSSGDCWVLDKPSGDKIDKLGSIEELLLTALTTALN